MIHSTWLEVLATERRQDLLAAARVRPTEEAAEPKLRGVLGRLLADFGPRLGRDAPAGRSAIPGRITETSYRLAARSRSTAAGAEGLARR